MKRRLYIFALLLLTFMAVSVRAFTIVPVEVDTAASDTTASGYVAPASETLTLPETSGNVTDDTAVHAPETKMSNIAPAQDSSAAPIVPPRSRDEISRMSREDLFRLAFGRGAAQRTRTLVMVLFADGRRLGNAEIVYDADFSAFRFISSALSKYLDTSLVPEARAAAGDSVGYFYSKTLITSGYEVVADEPTYELRVTAPPQSKVLQRRNLKGGYALVPAGEKIDPAILSFYMNYRLNDSYTYADYYFFNTAFNQSGRARADLSFDGALNLLGFVLEGSGWVGEPEDGQPFTWDNYRRYDVRIVRDIVVLNARVTAGDIGQMGGVRYEHNEWMFGGDPRDGESSVVFFMPRRGYVEVYMDGVYRQRFMLPAGRHSLSGFGGFVGRNQVRLLLRMEDGSTEEVPFEYMLGDPRNVRRGEARYSLQAGFERRSVASPMCYEYDPNEPGGVVDFMYGVSRTLSAGFTGQISKYNGIAGGQTSWEDKTIGWLSTRANMSLTPVGESLVTGQRWDVTWSPNLVLAVKHFNRRLSSDVRKNPLLSYLSLSLRGYYQSAFYNTRLFRDNSLVNGVPENPIAGGASGALSFAAFRGGISVSGGVVVNRDTAVVENEYSYLDYYYGLRVSQSFSGFPISLSAGMNVTNGVHRPYFSVNTGYNFGLGLRHSASYGRHRFSASSTVGLNVAYTPLELKPDPTADPDSGVYVVDFSPMADELAFNLRTDAGWQWSNGTYGNGAQSYSAKLSLPNLPDNLNHNVITSGRQVFNRGLLVENYRYTNTEGLNVDRRTHSVGAALSGSFMFADGMWAFGRPVNGSFILVDARHSLKGANVHINRSHYYKQDYSRNGWLGAAYQNNAAEYSPTSIRLTLTDAPSGAMLENNRYYALGGYRQGYALRLGAKERVLMQVRFTDGGKPVTYAYVTVEPENATDASSRRATFTGGDGVLQMSDLERGEAYVIRFDASTNIKSVTIEIPRDAELIFEYPDVSVTRE